MPENIIQKHVTFFVTLVEALGAKDTDKFDDLTEAGAYCIKHDLSPNAYIKHVFDNYTDVTGSVKTLSNDIGCAIANIKKCGSVKDYEKYVDGHNDKATRRVFSHQTFAMKLGTRKVAKKKTVAKRPALSLAVKQGIITQAQAKALKAMGF
ncbi:MAG: hypothetical protein O2815_07510 [Actinomycetota bacterium]|nr:hypothetical protein [Actinomycetota bacterium]